MIPLKDNIPNERFPFITVVLVVINVIAYLISIRQRHWEWYQWLWRIDRRVAGWPLLRGIGDHFLMVMRKR